MPGGGAGVRLALGTAQYGADYGTFNPSGRLAEAAVADCLERARAAGIDMLDTARAYGASEEVLGRLGAARDFRIVTKVARLGDSGPDAVLRSVEASLAALDTDHVHGLLMHDSADLAGKLGELLALTPEARADLGAAARRVAVERWSWSSVSERLLSLHLP